MIRHIKIRKGETCWWVTPEGRAPMPFLSFDHARRWTVGYLRLQAAHQPAESPVEAPAEAGGTSDPLAGFRAIQGSLSAIWENFSAPFKTLDLSQADFALVGFRPEELARRSGWHPEKPRGYHS